MKSVKVYIHDEKTKGHIEALCRDLGAELLTAADVAARAHKVANYDSFLDEVDLLILEITQPTPDLQFILAQAVLLQKPTLCLYAKNQAPRELLQRIRLRGAPKPLRTFSYLKQDLPQVLRQFIAHHRQEGNDYFNAPSLKYTVRLSRRTEQYLHYVAEQRACTKADVIRDLLQQQMESDKAYDENGEGATA